MDNYTIREAGSADRQIIGQLLRVMMDSMATMGGWLVNDDTWPEFVAQLDIGGSEHKYWLGETLDGEAVGLVEARLITPDMVFQLRRILHIHAVVVVESHRHRGLGRALTETALAWGREAGCVEAQLNVLKDNPAQSLYAALGFEVRFMTMWQAL